MELWHKKGNIMGDHDGNIMADWTMITRNIFIITKSIVIYLIVDI